MERGRPKNGTPSKQRQHVIYKGKYFNIDELARITEQERRLMELEKLRKEPMEMTMEGIDHHRSIVNEYLHLRKKLIELYCPRLFYYESVHDQACKEKEIFERELKLVTRESRKTKYQIRINRASVKINNFSKKIKQNEERYLTYDPAKDPLRIKPAASRVRSAKRCHADIMQ